MRHSTIHLMMDAYGHLMHDADTEAVQRVAALVSGSKTVANQRTAPQEDGKCFWRNGGWGRNRTGVHGFACSDLRKVHILSVYDDESDDTTVAISLVPFHGDCLACNQTRQVLP